MPLIMQCPFFKKNEQLRLQCEGGMVKFPDKEARTEYLTDYCANSINWNKCTICRNLENYYERKES